MSEEDFVLIPPRKRNSKIWSILMLLIITYSIASMLDSSALGQSQSNTVVIWATLIVFVYVITLTVMKAFGQKPNKFEALVFPGIILLVLNAGLTSLGIDVVEEENTSTTITTFTPEPTLEFDPDEILTNISQNQGTNQVSESQSGFNLSDQFVFLLWITAFVIIVLSLIFYLLRRNKNILPIIHIAQDREYTKHLSQNNKQIMEYYIDASILLENLKGRAPIWYSPTGYSNEVIVTSGTPIGNYFTHLTTLYEDARFSKRKISIDDVQEAIELHRQIKSWVLSNYKEGVK